MVRNVQFADEPPNNRRNKAKTFIKQLQQEYEETKEKHSLRKQSRGSISREAKTAQSLPSNTENARNASQSLIETQKLSSSPALKKRFSLLPLRKKKGSEINLHHATIETIEQDEVSVAYDKRLAGVINDKAGHNHLQRAFSLQRYPSLSGGNNAKLRVMLKKHSITKKSFEFQSIIKQLRTNNNRSMLESKCYLFSISFLKFFKE